MLIRASRYLGVSPWDLAAQSVYWAEWARICENAEAWSSNERQAHALAAAKNAR